VPVVQKPHACDDLPERAIRALKGIMIDKRLVQEMQCAGF
jgi:hypothetical protein